MKVVCFVKQKEKDSKKFCYPFIVPKKSLRKEHIIEPFFIIYLLYFLLRRFFQPNFLQIPIFLLNLIEKIFVYSTLVIYSHCALSNPHHCYYHLGE